MCARETAELLVQVGRLVQAEGYDGELSPAQWMALRFFARANQFSRNPSAFAEFQATTRGTATQTIKLLEAGRDLGPEATRAEKPNLRFALPWQGQKRPARSSFARLVRAPEFLARDKAT